MKFKQFRQQLDEGRRASPRVKALLSSRAKPYEYWLSKKFTLPFCISKPMMTRMQNTQVEVEAFHVTDIDHIGTLFEVQNSSKSLSVTKKKKTYTDGVVIMKDIQNGGGILVKLLGDKHFHGNNKKYTPVAIQPINKFSRRGS